MSWKKKLRIDKSFVQTKNTKVTNNTCSHVQQIKNITQISPKFLLDKMR